MGRRLSRKINQKHFNPFKQHAIEVQNIAHVQLLEFMFWFVCSQFWLFCKSETFEQQLSPLNHR